jgi:hypothetical protein
MEKKFVFTLILFIAHFIGQTQDTIVFKNGKIISVKVLEINPQLVKYRYFDRNDDNLHQDAKKKIARIKYANGVVDTIKSEYSASDQPPIERTGNRYHLVYSSYSKPIGERELVKRAKCLGKETGSHELLKSVRNLKISNQNTNGLFFTGIAVVAIGGLYCFSSLIQYPNAYKSKEQVAQIRKAGITVGLTSLGIGIGLETLALRSFRKKKIKMAKVVELYNSSIIPLTSPR